MFTLNSVGYNFIHPHDFCVDRPFGTEDYALIFARSHCFATLNGEKNDYDPNTLIIYDKHCPHDYGASNGEFINDWFHFDCPDLLPFLDEINLSLNKPYQINSPLILSDLIKEVFMENNLASVYREKIIHTKMECFFYKLSELIHYRNDFADNPYYSDFLNLRCQIYSNPKKKWRVDTLARYLNISTSYFQHQYKNALGHPISEDIILSKIEFAKYNLANSTLKVSYIADLCGYENPEHFMRLFKKIVGITPHQYRMTMR